MKLEPKKMKEPILTDVQLHRIGLELTNGFGAGDPTHKKLWSDIDRAMFVAANSPTFRAILTDLVSDS